MACELTDYVANFGANDVHIGVASAHVVMSPSIAPIWFKDALSGDFLKAELPCTRTAIADSNGLFTHVMPWPSESYPNIDPETLAPLRISIEGPDGIILRGIVPEGVTGPVTLKDLLEFHGWGIVNPSEIGPVAAVQGATGPAGPTGPTGPQGPQGETLIAGTIYVDATAGSDSNDGLTPATAVQTFQTALDRRRFNIKLLTDVTHTGNILFPGGGANKILVYADPVDISGPLLSDETSDSNHYRNPAWTFTPDEFKGMFTYDLDSTEWSVIDSNTATEITVRRDGVSQAAPHSFSILDVSTKLTLSGTDSFSGTPPGLVIAGLTLEYVATASPKINNLVLDMVLARFSAAANVDIQLGSTISFGSTLYDLASLFPGATPGIAGMHVAGTGGSIRVPTSGNSIALLSVLSENTIYSFERGGTGLFQSSLFPDANSFMTLLTGAFVRLEGCTFVNTGSGCINASSRSGVEVFDCVFNDPTNYPMQCIQGGFIRANSFSGTNANGITYAVILGHSSQFIVQGEPIFTGTTSDILVGTTDSTWAALTTLFDSVQGCYAAKI